MAHLAVKPSLISLPTELIEFCMQHSSVRTYTDLRSLSQTCRRMQAIALPLLWEQVDLTSVKQLGRFRELLRARPSVAPLVRSFIFTWDIGGDCYEDCLRTFREGTCLELAFVDRLQLWDELMKTPGAEIVIDNGSVLVDSLLSSPPGKCPEDWDLVCEQGYAAYDWHQSSRGGIGPDGEGYDEYIKSAQQFEDCITEVVVSLTKLDSFDWDTQVTTMPRGVFDALARLEALTDLSITFSILRCNLNQLPMWEIVGKLRSLTLRCDPADWPWFEQEDECTEASITTIDGRVVELIRAQSTQCWYEKHAECYYYFSLASHMIVAAARGGQLKELVPLPSSDAPFAVRALLPYWVQLETWNTQLSYASRWMQAAARLRSFLVHASLRRDWLQSSSNPHSSSSSTRLLTYQDLQAVQSYRENGGKLQRGRCSPQPAHQVVFERYLPWLLQDKDLAQQVLDVWAAIVERGEADKVECPCVGCQGLETTAEARAMRGYF